MLLVRHRMFVASPQIYNNPTLASCRIVTLNECVYFTNFLPHLENIGFSLTLGSCCPSSRWSVCKIVLFCDPVETADRRFSGFVRFRHVE